MVLIAGVKYACERCIRGHRVTTCNHTDQPLMMIKPKGRPSSQCKHCKEMRKNKNSHSTGSCTCAKVKKASTTGSAVGTSSSTQKNCGCEASKPCTCHGKRVGKIDISKKTNSRSSSTIPTNFPPGSEPQQQEEKISKTEVLKPTISSPSNAEGQGKFRQIGLDPLVKARPVGEHTRTRVGEVSVPLNEYIPNNRASMGNVSDTIPEGFFQDVPLPFEPGHGLLDLFNDTQQISNTQNKISSSVGSSASSYFTDTQNQTRGFSPSSLDSQRLTSPLDKQGSDFFPYYPMQHSQSTSTNNANSNTDIQRSTSMSFVSQNSSTNNLQYSASSDSLVSNMTASSFPTQPKPNSSTYHHHQYNNMLHNKPLNLNKSLFGNLDDRTDNDVSSIHSAEVLSLTPSFMDLSQTDKKKQHQQQKQRKTSNPISSADYFDLNSATSLNGLYSNNNFINSNDNFFSPTGSSHSQSSSIQQHLSHMTDGLDQLKSPSQQLKQAQQHQEKQPDFSSSNLNLNLDLDFDPVALLASTTSRPLDVSDSIALDIPGLNGMISNEEEKAEENTEEMNRSSLFGNLSIPM